MRRKPWVRSCCLGWAISKMLFVGVSSIMQYQMSLAQVEAMQNNPNMQGASVSFLGMMQMFGALGIVFSIIWGWALPVFMLVWLSRRKIVEEIASWPPAPSLPDDQS